MEKERGEDIERKGGGESGKANVPLPGAGNAIAPLALKCSADKDNDVDVDTASVKRQVALIGSGHQVS